MLDAQKRTSISTERATSTAHNLVLAPSANMGSRSYCKNRQAKEKKQQHTNTAVTRRDPSEKNSSSSSSSSSSASSNETTNPNWTITRGPTAQPTPTPATDMQNNKDKPELPVLVAVNILYRKSLENRSYRLIKCSIKHSYRIAGKIAKRQTKLNFRMYLRDFDLDDPLFVLVFIYAPT